MKSNEELGGVIYTMCQATGFKLKSNKELPGPSQRFSFIIPRTKPGDSGDTPSDEQLQPMYTEIHPDTHEAYLLRLKNIHNGKKVLLVDADPQGDLTTCLGWDRQDELEKSLANVLEKVIKES